MSRAILSQPRFTFPALRPQLVFVAGFAPIDIVLHGSRFREKVGTAESKTRAMILLAAIVVLVCFALLVSQYWERLFAEETSLGFAPFTKWLGLGLILPSFAWLLLNCGVLPGVPPILPRIALAQSAGQSWVPLLFSVTAPGLLVIGSWWAAVSFVHFLTLIALNAEPRQEFLFVTGVVSVVSLPIAGVCWWGGSLPWAGVGLMLWFVPVTHCTVALASRPKPIPTYARAVARLKFGKYREAESEVIQQLERREDDFEGWMMLAELYANHFGDLAEADRTVRAVCDQTNVTPLQISIAFQSLADWHLKCSDNPVAAARALREVCLRLPESHFAREAQLRIQQLPASRQELLEQRNPKKIRLPPLGGDLDGEPRQPGPQLSRGDAATLANECVERLKRNPNDMAAREKLAVTLTEHLGKVDLGLEQIQLLLGMSQAPESKKAEWLSLLAAWHFRHRHDRDTTKQVLQRILREHSQSAQGFAAQRWLNLLEMEERTSKHTPSPTRAT
jgi:hypothetical protein